MKYIVILVISNMIFCSSLFCQEPAKCQVPVMDTLVKAKDTIKKQKPNIPDEQLDYDIFSIANTFPKLCPAYGKFNREEATEVLAAVWIDIRTKEKLKAGESVGPAVSNN